MMDQEERARFSFILSIWIEPAAGGRSRWRGHITHVPSGVRRSVQGFDDVSAFIVPYLEAAGVRIRPGSRSARLAARWRHYWRPPR
jgi:hypothetical protein